MEGTCPAIAICSRCYFHRSLDKKSTHSWIQSMHMQSWGLPIFPGTPEIRIHLQVTTESAESNPGCFKRISRNFQNDFRLEKKYPGIFNQKPGKFSCNQIWSTQRLGSLKGYARWENPYFPTTNKTSKNTIIGGGGLNRGIPVRMEGRRQVDLWADQAWEGDWHLPGSESPSQAAQPGAGLLRSEQVLQVMQI